MPPADPSLPNPPLVPVRVWDLPTRVFHVALALSVAAALATGLAGGSWMRWHLRCGEVVLSLIVFRWIWGFAGGHWSRFRQFPPAPRRAWRALRGPREATPGHGPLAALSVWALLLLLTLQVATGLVADDGEDTIGPLNPYVATSVAGRASGWHADVGAYLVLALVALHLAAIAWYAWRRRDPLVRAMWSGDKPLPASVPASRDGAGARLLALAIWALAFAAVRVMVHLAG